MIRNMVNSHRTRDEIRSRALFITSVYAILGAGWILGSDHLASLLAGEMEQGVQAPCLPFQLILPAPIAQREHGKTENNPEQHQHNQQFQQGKSPGFA